MAIRLKQRTVVHSHQAGSLVWVPNSCFGAKLYPTRVEIYDYSSSLPNILSVLELNISEKVRDFTIELDLERGQLFFSGFDGNNYYKFLISAHSESIAFQLKRRRGASIEVRGDQGESYLLNSGEGIVYESSAWKARVIEPSPKSTPSCYYLGSNKKMEWERLKKKLEPKEIFPILFKAEHFWSSELKAELLESSTYKSLVKQIEGLETLETWQLFLEYLSTHLNGLLLSSANDWNYQGGNVLEVEKEESSLFILGAISILAKAFYFQRNERGYSLLQSPHPKIVAGRFLNLHDESLSLSFSWSRRKIREVQFHLVRSSSRKLFLPRGVNGFRLSNKSGSFKKIHEGAQLDLSGLSPGLYKLDRFH